MVDQAQRLRELMWNAQHGARVIAVTSGKGGVGKTNTSVNLAISLAARGKKVILADADLGLANVEVLMGLGSMYNIEQVVDGDRDVRDIVVQAPGGIRVVPGSSGMAGVADMPAAARERLLSGIQELHDEADIIIIDTMAGIGKNAVSFVTAADEIILVTTPEPSAIVDAYAMLKTIYLRREDATVRLLVNMAANQPQAKAVANKLSQVAHNYLGRNLPFLGFLPRDPHVVQAVMQSRPFMLSFPQAPASKYMELIAGRLLQQQQVQQDTNKEGFLKRFARNFGLASNG
jgi:flagellar biosynthesis protein FlhG